MKIDQYGRVFRSDNELVELLYTHPNVDFSKLEIPNIDKFLASANACGIHFDHIDNFIDQTVEEFDKKNQSQWFMPEDYCPNLVEML